MNATICRCIVCVVFARAQRTARSERALARVDASRHARRYVRPSVRCREAQHLADRDFLLMDELVCVHVCFMSLVGSFDRR